jgi:hypothetical protein
VAAVATPILLPPGYVRQQLEPTGGQIARPIDGYFHTRETPGERIAGEATVVYIISSEGLDIEPRIVQMDDPRLEPPVLAAVLAWRFEPATLSGRAMASLASQQFAFDLADPED